MLRDGNLVGFREVLNKGKCQGFIEASLGDRNYQINRYVNEILYDVPKRGNIMPFLYREYPGARYSLRRVLNNSIYSTSSTSSVRLIAY